MTRARSTTAWPTRSPDLKQLDFYLWIHFKYIAYAVRVNDAAEVQLRVETDAGNCATFLVLLNSYDNLY
jgi:hypothetical protein